MWYTPSNRRFKIGDKVVLSKSSQLMTSHMAAKDAVGTVIGFVAKEKTTDIIRVQCPDYEYIISAYSGEFEPAE